MDTKVSARNEVIMGGLGGRGVLVTGKLMAKVAMSRYRYVTWCPAYAAAMRGGASECTVIMSNEEIAAPILAKVQSAIVFDASWLKPLEERLKWGGLMIVDSSITHSKATRDDLKPTYLPATDVARKVGDIQATNMVLLGAYIELTKAAPIQDFDAELDRMMGDRNRELLKINKDALRVGARLAREDATSSR